MSIPYATMSWWSKMGFLAASDVYNYDDALPVYVGDRKTKAPEDLKLLKSLRSTPALRGDLKLDDGSKMRYSSAMSADSVGVYTHMNPSTREHILVLAFRGTDTVDPARFMNWIPEDYVDKLVAEIQKKISDPKKQWYLDRTIVGSSQFDANLKRVGIPLQDKDVCGSFCSSSCEPGITKESLMADVTGSYCGYLVSTPKTQQPDKSRFWNIYRYPVTPEDVARVNAWPEFNGGANNAQTNSDCSADRSITVASLPLGSSDVRNDEKHKVTAQFTMAIIQKMMAQYKTIVFAGHSLGGSLALNAYSLAVWLFQKQGLRMYYAGFNPASPGNFDHVLKHLKAYDPQWQYRAMAHRNSKDVVSAKTGSYMPTITYTDPRFPSYFATGKSYVHSISTMRCTNASSNMINSRKTPKPASAKRSARVSARASTRASARPSARATARASARASAKKRSARATARA